MSVYILSGARTPVGSFLGSLSTVSAPKLGAIAIEGAIKKAALEKSKVDEVFMGNVVQSGVGQAPARQASIFAGLSESTPSTTINKVCGSGMQTIISAAQTIKLGENNVVVAGGMENMSLAPHLILNSRVGTKFGEGVLKDSMQWDGLWDVYSDRPMGNCAEECAKKYEFTREQQDDYAISSFKKAQRAQEEGIFTNEIIPVEIKSRKGTITVSEDEGPKKASFEKIPKLRPAFDKNGTITAANASTINDGAAALVLASEEFKDKAKFKIVAYAKHAQNPTWFTTAPVEAIKKCLGKADLNVSDIGAWEINEAFAVVAMSAIKELELDRDKVNIFGSGVSLGHPIGASGTRITLSLMNALENRKEKYGIAAICIGGGEALSLLIERL